MFFFVGTDFNLINIKTGFRFAGKEKKDENLSIHGKLEVLRIKINHFIFLSVLAQLQCIFSNNQQT